MFPHLAAISAFFPFSGPALETTLSFHGICLAAMMFCMPAGLYFIHQQPCLEQCLIFCLPFVVISSFVQCLCALMSIRLSCAREAAARQKSPKDFCFPFPHEFRHKEVHEEYFMNNSALVGQCPPCQAGGQHLYRTMCSPEAHRNLIWGNPSCSAHSFTPSCTLTCALGTICILSSRQIICLLAVWRQLRHLNNWKLMGDHCHKKRGMKVLQGRGRSTATLPHDLFTGTTTGNWERQTHHWEVHLSLAHFTQSRKCETPWSRHKFCFNLTGVFTAHFAQNDSQA